MWFAKVGAFLWDLLGKKSNRVRRGVERDPSDLWPLVRFLVFLWALISKVFFVSSPILLSFVGLIFWYVFVFFHSFSMKTIVFKKERLKCTKATQAIITEQ